MTSDNSGAIRRALISVSDKTGIVPFAQALSDLNIEILSTGGTYKLLASENISAIEISDYTGFPEMMDGRVKTLHPKVHGGILARRDIDQKVLIEHDIPPIDLVVVNLYPFEAAVANPNCDLPTAIENIDIGGPTMLRAAAKNNKFVAAVVNPSDYDRVIELLTRNDGSLDQQTRFDFAVKTYEHTAAYDGAIANYLGTKLEQSDKSSIFPRTFNTQFIKSQEMRYGENPHQKAAFYVEKNPKDASISSAQQLQGKALSYNNIADTDAAVECIKSFSEPACVIVKHANPCGVAETDKLSKSYDFAYKTDPTSAFGGIIAFNKKVDSKLVKKIISQQFVEVIAAPAFDKECIDIIKIKPNIRLLLINNFNVKKKEIEIKSLKNKMLIQESDSINITERDLKKVTIKKPTKTQIADLLFAFKVSRYVKSNSIVFAKNGRTLGIGAGQMSRIDSTNIAKTKAKNHGLSLKGCVMASEAFFPFRDNVDLAKKIGVTAIIQPGGSISDKDIIDVVNKHKMSMVLSGIRVFKH